jgi:hypothetical protein
VLIVLLACGAPLRAAAADGAEPPPSLQRRPAATAAAIFPGIVVHGTGHLAAGDRRTGYRLLAMEGAGVGLTAGGFVILAATGASRHLAAPIFALPVAGVGLMLVSWLADVQGVGMPPTWRGAPLLTEPSVELRAGTRYVYDPTLSYGTLLGPGADLRWRRLRVSPAAWIATSGGNLRASLELAYRPWGRAPWSLAADGSFAEVIVGGSHHRYRRESFQMTVLEAEARGRIDLRRLAESLQGSFAEWGLGLGWGLTHYAVGARETDADGLLLARFGYGLYFGEAPGRTGELVLYYDHRHDDYAGGAKLEGLGSGAAGHGGVELTWWVAGRWGVRLEGQAGAAYLAGLSLLHRSRLPAAGGAP